MYEVKYLDDVIQDIREAKKWYKEKQPGLEKRFSGCIEDTIQKIAEMPTAFSIRYKNVRIAILKYFLTIFIFKLKNLHKPS